MNKVIKKLTFSILLFSSFSTWLALHDYIRFNILLILCILIINIINYKKAKPIRILKSSRIELGLICIFIAIISLSFFFNFITNYQSKLISNYIATLFIVFLLYFYYSSIINNYIDEKNCIKGLACGGILLLIIVTIDSILVNFANIEIRNFFIIGYEGNTSYFRRSAWISPSSPTEEPGITALYLNILIPFTLYYFRKWRFIIATLFIFCIFSLFSTVGLLILITGSFYILLLKANIKTQITIFITIFFLISLTLNIILTNEYVQLVISQWNFIDKITLSGNSTSSSERAFGLQQAIIDGLDSPLLGKGPGYGKSIINVGYLSTFFSFLGNYGFLAFFCFCTFWLLIFKKCFHICREYKYLFIYSFYATTIGALIGDNLHNFALWMLIPIICKFYNHKKLRHEKNITHS